MFSCITPISAFGAGDRTRTCTVARQILNLVRLPISPRPHVLVIIAYFHALASKFRQNIMNIMNRVFFSSHMLMW